MLNIACFEPFWYICMSELLALFEREIEVVSLELLDLVIFEFELVLEFERCTEFERCIEFERLAEFERCMFEFLEFEFFEFEFLEFEFLIELSGLAVPDELHPPFDEAVFVVAE